jgi:hypothetical protein
VGGRRAEEVANLSRGVRACAAVTQDTLSARVDEDGERIGVAVGGE